MSRLLFENHATQVFRVNVLGCLRQLRQEIIHHFLVSVTLAKVVLKVGVDLVGLVHNLRVVGLESLMHVFEKFIQTLDVAFEALFERFGKAFSFPPHLQLGLEVEEPLLDYLHIQDRAQTILVFTEGLELGLQG